MSVTKDSSDILGIHRCIMDFHLLQIIGSLITYAVHYYNLMSNILLCFLPGSCCLLVLLNWLSNFPRPCCIFQVWVEIVHPDRAGMSMSIGM